jgi:hypothetical protein
MERPGQGGGQGAQLDGRHPRDPIASSKTATDSC